MKKLLILILLMAATAFGQSYKLCYIIAGSDTNVHNSNVDSIRHDIVNDPQGQLPGTWTVDLLSRSVAESQNAAYWANYNVIMTWGPEESGSNTYDASVDGILDTIHKPVICRDGYLANGDPMFLGTGRISSLNSTNAPSHFRVNNYTHFITKRLYTNDYYFGDSLMLYALTTSPNTDGLTGMAYEVQTLLRMARDRDAGTDSAVLVICESGDSLANGSIAPDKRAFISINSSWRYCSWNARDMFYRTLRWAVGDTVEDTCVTQVRVACEGVDGSWLEYYGTNYCQGQWHYGNTGTIRIGYETVDRAGLVRFRSRAIDVALPDTSGDYAYDITSVKASFQIGIIYDGTPNFSFWQGLFNLNYDTLWIDAKESFQLDTTCGSFDGTIRNLSNAQFLKFPTIYWNSNYANTRGTDYETDPLDSVWIQDPVVDNILVWDIPVSEFLEVDEIADSAANQGYIFHTMGTRTGTAEIDLRGEQKQDASNGPRSSPQLIIELDWREKNTTPADLDSSILIQTYAGGDSAVFTADVDGSTTPSMHTLVVSNGSSSAAFGCASTVESPSADWLTTTVIGGGTTTYYVTLLPSTAGLAAGYYSTWIKATCSGVADSPDSAKVILRVSDPAARPTGGFWQIR